MGNQKNPWAVAVASFLVAGCGHVYNGERWGKGAIFFCMRFIGVPIGTAIIDCTNHKLRALILLVMIIIPWIVVGLIDAMTAFSTAWRMNDGEILFKENNGVGFWVYSFVISLLTIGFFFFIYLFSF